MFEKRVKNKDGFEKRVLADTQAELDEAVKAVREESAPVSPDIDNPDHGNMTTAEFIAYDGKRNQDNDAESVPTSEESKTLSKKLAAADGDKKEMAEILQKDSDQKTPDISPSKDGGPVGDVVDGKSTKSDDKKAVDNSKKS